MSDMPVGGQAPMGGGLGEPYDSRQHSGHDEPRPLVVSDLDNGPGLRRPGDLDLTPDVGSDPYWNLLAAVILQAVADGIKGHESAHRWLMQPHPWFQQLCDAMGLEIANIQRQYLRLRERNYRLLAGHQRRRSPRSRLTRQLGDGRESPFMTDPSPYRPPRLF
jgi:hypothetical protein